MEIKSFSKWDVQPHDTETLHALQTAPLDTNTH